MPSYNFKKITVVPTAKDFVDIMLSKTQRKTPTVVHKQFKISRIRKFYMTKVKYTQQAINYRFTNIINEFPKLEDLHPFYADLLNTLYNKDHYKLSLGQINMAKHLVDKVGSDYVKLLKFGDSLYRCKQLKRAALGRMVTIVKKQAPALKYLEDVRQHLSRLPSIDPNTRTLLLCGCPNAGKSSFINLITRADVEVQPYAFTTKSLYVGHTDYEFLRWQVIDTPGILDRPFEEMNTIELQAITALAHIRAAVIFIIDISELCGIPIDQQMKIYDSIKPLFANKPLFVACNKTDVTSLADLEKSAPGKRALISALEKEDVPVCEISTLTTSGVMDIKKKACDSLLAQRVDMKLRGKKADLILNRLHVAMPKRRDNIERKPYIPEAVLLQQSLTNDGDVEMKKKLEKDVFAEMEEEYDIDLNKNKDLENTEWKYDKLPQIWEGHNIADFIDPDILMKLKELLTEEEVREKVGYYDSDNESEPEDIKEIRSLAKKIRERIAVRTVDRRVNSSHTGKVALPRVSRKRERSVSRLREEMENLGVDMSDVKGCHFTKTDKTRSVSQPPAKKVKFDLLGRPAVGRKIPRDLSGLRDAKMVKTVKKIERKARDKLTAAGLKGESDRHIYNMKPKHLLTGKRGIGKTTRR